MEYEKRNRVSEALSIRGMKAAELVERSGVSKSAISGYTLQKWQPKQKPLLAMAKVLDVSEMWLAGFNVPMERPFEQKKADEIILVTQRLRSNEKFFNLVKNLSTLNEDHFSLIENMVTELAKADCQKI